jgi:hypothetical protein
MAEKIEASNEAPSGLARALKIVAAPVALLSLLMYAFFPEGGLEVVMFRFQDFALLLLGVAVMLALAFRPAQLPAIRLPRPAILVPAIALAALAVTGAGTWLVFGDTPTTRDEILADFDALFIAQGMLIAPVPEEWRSLTAALMPQFMLPVPAEVGWLSGYLPGNAALRAIGVLTIGPEWTNPVLAAISILALHRIGRRLWPEAPGAALAATLLLASSAQFLVMAMTPWAMSAHLAFNLLWLASFMRADRKGDAAALLCGFIATGLHQMVFHPLFVAPFIVHLWLTGQRRRALVYVAFYAAICLFWASYWQILLAGAASSGGASTGGVLSLFGRAAGLIATIDLASFSNMAFNLLRFVIWQNIVLVPLALLAWPAIRRGDGIARPLAAGVLLSLAALFVLMPWQGLGWGYRYLHGLIGNLCLLAGYGWIAAAGEGRRRHFVLAAGAAASMLVMLPMQLKFAHIYAAPRTRASALIAAAPTDVVLIVPARDLFDDQIRNAPDLTNRPIILDARRVSAAQIQALCSRYRVGLFDIRVGLRIGIPATASPDVIALHAAEHGRYGCAAPLPAP